MSGIWRRAALVGALLLVAGTVRPESPDDANLASLRKSIVSLRVEVGPQAHSAATLGQHRAASGVVIDDKGLILTVGYVILEASAVDITGPDGAHVPGTVIGYHAETGFGLVRALSPLRGAQPMRFGSSASVQVKDPVLIMAYDNSDGFTSGLVVSRRTFTGYWEYILEDPLYTVPAVRNFAGAALVDKNLTLVGVGSLIVNDALEPDESLPGNVFIPIDALKPVLGELTSQGRSQAPPRPWLGVNVVEQFGRVVVVRVTESGPAQQGGMAAGDMIFEVAGKPVTTVEEFLRALWRQGKAGETVPLTVLQRQSIRELSIPSGDRYQFYRVHPLY